jgi:DNA-directed RNA polymerase subunit RPC12/RpoP
MSPLILCKSAVKTVRFDCPRCGQHFEAAADAAMQTVECPNCQSKFVPTVAERIPPILPLSLAALSVGGIAAISKAPPDFSNRNSQWLAVAFVVCGVVFLWSVIRLVWTLTSPEKRGHLLVLTGIGLIALAWIAGSMPGVMAGGFLAVIGAIFTLRPAVK